MSTVSGLTFSKIELSNFLSFGPKTATIDLDHQGTTLVVGENVDVGGSSGAGKSTIIAAITYALYDKIPSGVSKERLINASVEKKSSLMSVKLYFGVNGVSYTIIRQRGSGGQTKLLEGDKDITPSSIGLLNAKIEQLIGLSYLLFSRVVLFLGSERSFLDYSVGEQRALFEELFKITTLSLKADVLRKRISQTDKDLAVAKSLLAEQQKHVKAYDARVADALARVERWENNRAANINRMSIEIEQLRDFNFAQAEEDLVLYQELTNKLQILQTDRAAKVDALNLVKSRPFEKTTELAMTKNKLSQTLKQLETVKGELTHLLDSTCPYCKQGYHSDEKVAESMTLKSKLSEEATTLFESTKVITDEQEIFNQQKHQDIMSADQALTAITAESEAVRAEVSAVKGALKFTSTSELYSAKGAKDQLESNLSTIMAEINPHLEPAQALADEVPPTLNDSELSRLNKLQEHQQFLLKLLIDKNSFVRKNIVSQTLPLLNRQLGKHAEQLLLPHLVRFQPDMTCEISQHGRLLDHGNLSNGEKKRLGLALTMAFRDVLTLLHTPVKALFTDEIDGGALDSTCLEAIIQVLKQKAYDDNLSVFIISHRPEFDGRCDRQLTVRKERGVSSMVED